jgi:hypothetical protein
MGVVIVLLLIGVVGTIVYENRCNRLLKKLESQRLESRRQLEESAPRFITHTVLMDGISGSGKSSFIARLVSPVSTTSELQNMTATVSEYQSVDIPVCWEPGERTILHSLRFFDVAGENSATVINALHTLSKQAPSGSPNVVLVIIWDISSQDKWGESFTHFNKQSLQATYGNEMALNTIRSIIVFFNKIDLVDEQTANQRIRYAEANFNKHFKNTFERGYGDIQYISGSVLQGTRVHDCLGAILQKLGLAPNFHQITGNASSSKNL